ncbi:MAG: asparagine synthase (glutamine-hydrolyzing) [Acidobacteriaceae bacterium]|jgi:asparagine synthase (glutamine-hydrolysing)
MCGISGVLAFKNSNFEVTADYLARMRDTMVHRGPDGAGLWISPDRRLGLAHRRLSIIDLSNAASQPMSHGDGSLHIVFNGEIYNHAEVRRELEDLGHRRWKTDHSDTEVILHAFAEWGIDCLHKFRGMFAIALWDAKARRLWLIRDRIGIKPLYYSVHHGRITFASEIKALLQDPDQARAVNEEGLFHYLSFLTTPAPDTLFAGIHKLPPGTFLTIDADGQSRQERYWEVLEHTTLLTGVPEEEIAERLLAELRTSVALRTVSDVPVGVFLSGGIDSSTNAALFSECATDQVKTFSVGYDKNYRGCQSELPRASQFAASIGATHHERVLTQQDFLDFLPRLVYLQDEPIADPVCMPVYFLSQLARDNGIVVAQAGEGSDELFWGYEHWKRILKLVRWNGYPVPHAARRVGLLGLSVLGKSRGSAYELLWRANLGLPVFWGGSDAFSQRAKLDVLSPRLRRRFRNESSWQAIRPIHERFTQHAWEQTPVKWMTYLDLNLRLPELLLMRLDKMGMGASLEARVPFLDHKFVQLAMSIPEQVITKESESKHILKKAVRGLIPDDIIDRQKQGFGVPVQEWFLGQSGEFARRELTEFSDKTDFLDHAAVMNLIQSRRGSNAWLLLNFALWWKEFIEGGALSSSRQVESMVVME